MKSVHLISLCAVKITSEFDIPLFRRMGIRLGTLAFGLMMIGCGSSQEAEQPQSETLATQDKPREVSETPSVGFDAENSTIGGKPTKTIETPWGAREVYDLSQIPNGSPLVFDATLERVHTYFSKLEVCETKKVLDDRKSCVEKTQSSHAELWDNGRPPTIKIFSNYQDTAFAKYGVSDFKWDISLNGLLKNFELGGGRIFPREIHDDLLISYLQHHAQNNGIETVDLDIESDLPRPKFKGKSLNLLYKNFPEFEWDEVMPEEYASPYLASGHAFSMIKGKHPFTGEAWVTNYTAEGCRPLSSGFLKLNVVYKSPWLKDYLGNRDVAYVYLCSPKRIGVPWAVIFKLDKI